MKIDILYRIWHAKCQYNAEENEENGSGSDRETWQTYTSLDGGLSITTLAESTKQLKHIAIWHSNFVSYEDSVPSAIHLCVCWPGTGTGK